jgi:hypothetical protein
VKCPEEFRPEIGDAFVAHVPRAACHFFDAKTGVRIA